MAVYIEFFVKAVQDADVFRETGKVKFNNEDYVKVIPNANTENCYPAEGETWIELEGGERRRCTWGERFPKQYEAFKNNQEQLPEGVPISEINFVSPAQYEMCKRAKVFTVEQLAKANAPDLAKIGQGANKIKSQAKAWLDSGDQTKTANDLIRLDGENKELKDLVKDQAAQLAMLTKQVTGLTKEK